MNSPIQSLWIGKTLSTLETLSIQSFLDHGHPYHLYVYGDLTGLPAGAVLKDGNDILPAAQIFQYRDRPSYAAFANMFRYKLLLDRGGVWADTDVVSLRKLDLPDDYVFASETVAWRDLPSPTTVVTNCLLKAPSGSSAMALAFRICMAKDREALRWGETGPRLVAEVVEASGLQHFVRPPSAFCPIAYKEWWELISPQPPPIPAEAYTIHFWNEMWRLADQDKSAEYPPQCLYEQLKRRHLRRTESRSGAAAGRGVELLGDTPGPAAHRGCGPS